ncbi:EAL domain-containing protein [Xanthomonas euvesicatoria]
MLRNLDIWPTFLGVAALGQGGGYYEALLRTSHSAGHVEILQQAEAAQTIGILDVRMLDMVLSALSRTKEQLRIGVNVSAATILCDASKWLSRLASSAQLASRLVVELTETAEHADLELAVAFAEACRKFGAAIAIDDYDSAKFDDNLVHRVRPDFIKLGSVWRPGSAAEPRATLAAALSRLSAVRPRQVVVEWVDSREKYLAAEELSVSHIQGSFVGNHVGLGNLIQHFGLRDDRSLVA